MTMFFSAAGILTYRLHRAEQQRFIGRMRRVAVARGAAFHARPERQPRGSFSTLCSLEADVGQARVYLKGERTSKLWIVEGRVQFILPAGPSFKIQGEDLISSVVKEYVADKESWDATLGDPAFDDHFRVQCADIPATREVWSAASQALLVEHFPDALISSDGKEITFYISQQGAPTELESQLDHLLDLLGALAVGDLSCLEAFRALPEAAYLPPTGPWNERTVPRVRLQLSDEVFLGPTVIRGVLASRAFAPHPVVGAAVEIPIDEDGQVEALHAKLLPAPAVDFLPEVGRGVLHRNAAETTLIWQNLETDPRRLLAGARLVDSFARSSSRGIYR